MKNILKVNNLSFHYSEYDSRTNLPTEGHNGISDVSFEIPEGSFVVLCGSTGSGKSTLLKLLKRDIITSGRQSGEIIFSGKNITEYSDKELASSIGLLFQNPEDQIVTDKVWHEIAFGLENIGLSQSAMENRLAEALAFFRLENLWHNDCASLSGGQKQLVSLAGVLAMYPRLLLLDEPTSQLDPEAAEHYISTIKKLQSSLGITVIIAEHNLSRLLPVSDMLMIMENGSLLHCGQTEEVLRKISESAEDYTAYDFPLPVRFGISNKCNSIPLDIISGAVQLRKMCDQRNFSMTDKPASVPLSEPQAATPALRLKNISFRYSPKGNDVIAAMSTAFNRGTIYALLGCNASGKSTLLNLLAGNLKPQLGSFSPSLKSIKIAYMPQATDNMFISDTIEKEMNIVGVKPDAYPSYIKYLDITRGPLELSGGEKQLLALAKVSVLKPDILLLDEPTKGTDSVSRKLMMQALTALKTEGTTVIMACHDMDFAAECADKCAIMSMGRITSFRDCSSFFTDNQLYTTPARAMSRGIIDNIYLDHQLLDIRK